MIKDCRLQLEAISQMVCKSSPGGISQISRAIGAGERVLGMKLNPNCDHHVLTLGEAAAITAYTQNPQIVDAMAALCDRTTLPVSTDQCLVAASGTLERLTKEFSDCVPGMIQLHKSTGLGREKAVTLQRELMELAQLAVYVAREIGSEYGG
ncbi:hypothetical protein LIN78_11980 [Leeia sp. TBRC 13508]|uniref:Uncharacterized protein n=1 Tax=Leeia speluncae TaxID=2884804 RepID=A0ABS8D9H7_9NEIS|nr:phage regulatory CII family protein [Leeia speluncae]MCB6184263.1 hypothetical protein [Leeia speluncae]